MSSNFFGGTWRGAVTGLIAGLIFFVLVGLAESSTGGFFFLARGAAIPIFGAATGAGPIFVGFLLHLLVAALWGITFGWLAWSQPKGLTMMLGLCWGFLAWAVMTFAIAPAVGAGDWVRTAPLGRYLVCHAIFGFVLGLTFAALQRRDESPGRILPRLAESRA